MLLKTAVQKLFYKLFLLILSTLFASSGGYTQPGTQAPVTPLEDPKLVFAAIADPQISNYMFKRYPVFQAACEDLHNNAGAFDAVLIAGDIAENGLAEEYQLVYDGLSGLGCRYIAAQGNHDIRLRAYSQSKDRFCGFVNALNGDEEMDSFSYSQTVNGVKFIVLGSDKTEFEESYLSDDQLSWLDSELASANGEPVFVMCHQSLALTHGLPETWNSPFDAAGTVGKQNDELKAVLNKHENVVFITGHLHTGFGEYTYERIDNFDSVNIPSLCCNNDHGDYNENGIGFVVEVYNGKAVFRARDFAKGIWVPEHDIEIEFQGGNIK